MTEPKKDLDTPQKIRAALFKWVIRTSYHRGKDEVQDIIDRIPSPDAGEPKRDEAGLREAATFVEALGPIIDLLDLDGFDGEAECLRDLRTALAAHPAPSEPEGKALRALVLSMVTGVPSKYPPHPDLQGAVEALIAYTEHAAALGEFEACAQRRMPYESCTCGLAEARVAARKAVSECITGSTPAAPPESPWRPIEEFAGTEDTYFVIVDGSPFDACFRQGKWWISGIDEPVHPTRFMPIPDYPEWKARREAQYWEGTP